MFDVQRLGLRFPRYGVGVCYSHLSSVLLFVYSAFPLFFFSSVLSSLFPSLPLPSPSPLARANEYDHFSGVFDPPNELRCGFSYFFVLPTSRDKTLLRTFDV